MGLDMFLNRSKIVDGIKIWEHEPEEIKRNNPILYKILKKYEYTRGSSYCSWQSYSGEVGYWRKANHIHKWFVDNVQSGEDDCGHYLVTKEDLISLLKTARKVVDCFNEDGTVKRGKLKVVESLLPTCNGFFFGNTEYDEWYLSSVQDTIAIIEKALRGDEAIDWDDEVLVYNSSW